jgi:hypothetical protein
MTRPTRRVFLLSLAAAGPVLAGAPAGGTAVAQPARVNEKDPQAVNLGYVSDTNKADTKKYPKHTKDQKCAGCALYQGKAGDPAGNCPLFAGRQVAAGGWCGSWVKKA